MRGVRPGLIPCELWEYGMLDVLRGIGPALSRREPLESLSLPGVPDCVPVRSARAGIVLALRVLNLRRGARVGVPLFCCPVVFKAIEAAGCVPRFVDVDPSTCCVSTEDVRAKRGEMDALVAVHMFGNVCDIPGLRAAAPGVPIVEDCAQSLGSSLRNRPTGQFGHLAVFSFRAGKYISVGQGGAVFAADPFLRRRLIQFASELRPPSRTEECVHLGRSLVRAKLRSRPLYGLVGSALWRAYMQLSDHSTRSPLTLGRIYRTDLALMSTRLRDFPSAVAARRAHANRYATLLTGQSLALCAERPDTHYNRYQYPLLLPSSAHRLAVAGHLFGRGVDASKPYSDAVAVGRTHYRYGGDCPASESVADRVLVVPNHERLTQVEVGRIAAYIVEGLQRYASSGRMSTHALPATAVQP